MTPLDYVTGLEAALAALALAVRGNMLKPEAKGWVNSQTASLVIMALSILFALISIDVFRKGGASMREAVAYSGVAMGSVSLLIHLAMQHRGPESTH